MVSFRAEYLDIQQLRGQFNSQAMAMYAKELTSPVTVVKVGVGVIVVDNCGKILLEKRSDNGMWGLPGGGIEPGESVIETAHREVKEETNLEIRLTGLVGIYSEPSAGRIVTYPDNGDVRHLVDIVFTAVVNSGEISKSNESLEVKFFNPDSLPSDVVPPAIKPLQDFVAGKTCRIR